MWGAPLVGTTEIPVKITLAVSEVRLIGQTSGGETAEVLYLGISAKALVTSFSPHLSGTIGIKIAVHLEDFIGI